MVSQNSTHMYKMCNKLSFLTTGISRDPKTLHHFKHLLYKIDETNINVYYLNYDIGRQKIFYFSGLQNKSHCLRRSTPRTISPLLNLKSILYSSTSNTCTTIVTSYKILYTIQKFRRLGGQTNHQIFLKFLGTI